MSPVAIAVISVLAIVVLMIAVKLAVARLLQQKDDAIVAKRDAGKG